MNMDQRAPRAYFMLEPLTIDLTSVPATQNPKMPMTVCTAAMAVVTAATDGGLLSPLSECAISGPSAQNGINHKIMSADIGSPRLRRRCAPLCRSAYPRCAAGRYAATWASGRLIAATRRDTAITIRSTCAWTSVCRRDVGAMLQPAGRRGALAHPSTYLLSLMVVFLD